MTQFKDIPLATDQRNVSQNDIRQNFGYLMPAPSITATGILPVDHKATGNNTLNPSDGFHAQVSLVDRTDPASLTNSVNGQSSSGIFYSKTNPISGLSELKYKNSTFTYEITPCFPVRAALNYDGIADSIRNSFNIASVNHTGTGKYTINFTNPIGSINYFIQGIAMRNASSDVTNVQIAGDSNYGNSMATTFVKIETNGGTSSLVDVLMLNIIIFGG